MLGPKGSDMRYMLKYTDEKERREYLEKKIARDLPGVSLTSFEFVQTPTSGQAAGSFTSS